MWRRVLSCLVICAPIGMPLTTARAEQTVWSRADSSPGDWLDSANWTAGVPDAGDMAVVGGGGTVTLAGGGAVSDELLLGDAAGSGTVEHSGGSLHASGMSVGSNGRYLISGTGSLIVENEEQLFADGSSSAQFIQTGGKHASRPCGMLDKGWLRLGTAASAPAASTLYDLRDGKVYLHHACIGTSGQNNVLRQSGGYAEIGDIVLGQGVGASGTYELSEGTTWMSSNLILGHGQGSSGLLQMSGGYLNTRGNLFVAEGDDSHGTVAMSGGRLFADVMPVGWHGAGVVTQDGGEVNASSAILLGFDAKSSGEYRISGGSITTPIMAIGLTAPGRLSVTDPAATITVRSELLVGPQGVVEAAPGTTIHMANSKFSNRSTNPMALGDLDNVTLIFEGGDTVVDPFEVAGLDLGASMAGFSGNFAIGTLQLGSSNGRGRLRLVDEVNNSLANADREALYVQHLIIRSGSTLDLNGLHLYCQSFTGLDTYVLNGSVTIIPEPTAITVLLASVVAIRRHRHSPAA